MHDALHPDDERLAAYASADREAVSDRELAGHLAACDRCGPMVEELTLLRDALALLPDVAPSRPLRLIPPVHEPAARPAGALDWLRRLAAPAMAAGAGLVLIGAVGAVDGPGLVRELGAKAAGPGQEASATDGGFAPVGAGAGEHSAAPPALPDDNEYTGRSRDPQVQGADDSPTPAPTPSGTGLEEANNATDQPWLTVLIAGFGLFGISAVLRYSLAPRAG